jgi:hypothetical protein
LAPYSAEIYAQFSEEVSAQFSEELSAQLFRGNIRTIFRGNLLLRRRGEIKNFRIICFEKKYLKILRKNPQKMTYVMRKKVQTLVLKFATSVRLCIPPWITRAGKVGRQTILLLNEINSTGLLRSTVTAIFLTLGQYLQYLIKYNNHTRSQSYIRS